MQKAGRNAPCSCGSGKKYKKCCENLQARGRFKATLVDSQSAPQIQKILGLTSLFQAHLSATPKKAFPESAIEEQPARDPIVILEKNDKNLIT